MAQFARSKLDLLRQIVNLDHDPPSHDTFNSVFRLLDPEPFEAAFARFTTVFVGTLEGVVAIYGKALREAYERDRKATSLHLVNVWAAQKRLVIRQRLAPVAGVLEVLALLRLNGCIVTADALHCRPDTAQAILDTSAHYALAIKENRRSTAGRDEPPFKRWFLLSRSLTAAQLIDVSCQEDALRSQKDNAPAKPCAQQLADPPGQGINQRQN